MSVATVRQALLWCGLINYGLLIFWVLLYLVAREPVQRVARWFRLSPEQFDIIQYAGMVIYKLGIFLFNFVPYIALCIVG